MKIKPSFRAEVLFDNEHIGECARHGRTLFRTYRRASGEKIIQCVACQNDRNANKSNWFNPDAEFTRKRRAAEAMKEQREIDRQFEL